jgi:DNA-binding MurR/RpiR family transcriptional regulator
VASQVGINLATIIRFAQSLGYDGYQSMQAAIRHAYLTYAGLPVPIEPPPLSPGQTSLDLIRARHRSNLDTMFDQLDPREIDAVAELMLHARVVRACGDGASAHAATHLARLLRYTGVPALTIPAEGIDRPLYLYDAGSSDVVVGICLTTTLRGPVEVLERARTLGAHTVAISASKVNALAAAADYSFVAPAQGTTMVFSLVAAVAMVESIAWIVRSKRSEAATKIHNTLQDWYTRDGHVAWMTPASQQRRRRSAEAPMPSKSKRQARTVRG